MVTIFEEFLVGKWIGNRLYGHQRTNPGWISVHQRIEGLIPKGAMLVHSSMDHSELSFSFDLIKFGFIGVERGNDKLQFETFLKVLGLRV